MTATMIGVISNKAPSRSIQPSRTSAMSKPTSTPAAKPTGHAQVDMLHRWDWGSARGKLAAPREADAIETTHPQHDARHQHDDGDQVEEPPGELQG